MDAMQVQAAISALYGSDAVEAARANTFLMEFTEQPVNEKCFLTLLLGYVDNFVTCILIPAPCIYSAFSRSSDAAALMLSTDPSLHWSMINPAVRGHVPLSLTCASICTRNLSCADGDEYCRPVTPLANHDVCREKGLLCCKSAFLVADLFFPPANTAAGRR